MGANNAIGVSGVIALIAAFLLFRPKPVYAAKDCTRLTDNVGVTGILPQVLAALGAVFTAAGVGDVIAAGVSAVIPSGNLFAATAVYCIAMAVFTMIMGNGFAAFSVITRRDRYTFPDRTGSRSGGCRRPWTDSWLLRYSDDAHGC